MKKMSKKAILDKPLVSFNIRPLSLWVTRPEREMEKQLKATCKCSSDPAVVESELAITRVKCMEEVNSQPKTVGDLIKKYKYRFVGRLRFPGMNWYRVKIGNKPINELKRKLIELGLTPDDWPALVPNRRDLVCYLSKENIEALPLLEVFILETQRGGLYGLSRYLNCTEEVVRNMTLRDFLQVNPYHLSDEVNGISGVDFFKDHKRFLFALNQKLREKGFTREDGAFFIWNPVTHAHKKACAVLAKHKLSPQQIERFAKIVVAERWVI